MSATLFLLHGFTGSPRSWEAIVQGLPGQRCIAPPLLGHGADAPAAKSFADEVDRLAGLLPTGAVHLCGYSLGARLALGMLVRHPGRFIAATLIGVNPGLRHSSERAERRNHDDALARRLESDGIEAFVLEWEAQALFASQSALPEAVRARKRSERSSHDPRELARALRVLGLGVMPDLWPQLPGLHLPVNLVVGGRDAKFRELAGRATRVLPAARATVIPGAGHDLLLERPSDVAAVLREDLAPGAALEPQVPPCARVTVG